MKRFLGVAVVSVVVLLVGSAGLAEARGPRVFFDIGVPLWVGPGWWGPPYYYYPAPPVIVQQPPVLQPIPPSQPPVYWYYCPNPQGYYPYVQQCPSGWLQVVPSTAPPGR